MNTFPALNTLANAEGFVDEYSDEAVERTNYASGYPLVNSIFTFDPKNFSYVLENVSDSDKLILEQFYSANKSLIFSWANPQDGYTYQVIFNSKPQIRYMNNNNNQWLINISLRQANNIKES